jgi:molybdate transport system permease protein
MLGLSADEVGILALSLRVAIVSVLCSLPVAIVVAYGLARLSFPGKTLVDAIVHLPLVLPPVVVGFALLVLLGKRGPIGACSTNGSASCLHSAGPAPRSRRR